MVPFAKGPVAASELAGLVGGRVEGDGAIMLFGVAPVEDAEPRAVSFVANPRYRRYLADTKAAAVIVSDREETPPGLCAIRVGDPYLAFAEVLDRLVVEREEVGGFIHPTAVVSESASVDGTAYVGPCCVVEDGAKVGPRARLSALVYLGRGAAVGEDTSCAPHVSIMRGCSVGARCVLHSGVVIGSDGFGFAATPGGPRKVAQVGDVVVEDDVEIGANTTIDRAALGTTRVCRGAKLDNLVQIAHNVRVGEGTVIAAQTGVSGSARIGRGVRMAGQVGTIGHIDVGDGATIVAQAGVAGDVEKGATLAGSPAIDFHLWRRISAALPRLPDIVRRLAAIERALARE